MENKILEFINLLRDAGIRVSISESIDSYHALRLIDLFERAVFKNVLRTTLIKSAVNIPKFDKLFELYFQEPMDDQLRVELSEDEFAQQLQQMENMLNQEDFNELGTPKGMGQGEQEPTQPLDIVDHGKEERKKELFKQGSESEMQDVAREMAASRRFEEWETEGVAATIDRMMAENGMLLAKVEAKHAVRRDRQGEVDQNYKQFKELVRNEVEKSMVRQFGNEVLQNIVSSIDLTDVDLGNLTEDQLEEIKERIKKIARKISTRNSHREKLGKRGKINITKTIRSSIQYGNVASELRYKRKKQKKSKLVVFCDVSGSVYMYVSFMLQLVLALQQVFLEVESYVFVDTIKRITRELEHVDDIFELIKRYTNDPFLGGASDFGLAFDLFAKETVFDKKTIVIVIADAINYGMDAKPEYLREIANKCKAVYWLNPLAEKDWGSQACAQYQYEPYCKQVFECQNLGQLEDFVKKLVKI